MRIAKAELRKFWSDSTFDILERATELVTDTASGKIGRELHQTFEFNSDSSTGNGKTSKA